MHKREQGNAHEGVKPEFLTKETVHPFWFTIL